MKCWCSPKIDDYVTQTTKHKGWLTDYSVRHNFSSPARISELVRDLPYLSGSLSAVARQTMETLRNIYDAHTVSEWMEQKILPLYEKIDSIVIQFIKTIIQLLMCYLLPIEIQNDAAVLRSRKHWPVRPLKLFDQWDYYGVRFNDYFNLTSGGSSSTTTRQPWNTCLTH